MPTYIAVKEISFIDVRDSLLKDHQRGPLLDAVRLRHRGLVDLHEQGVQRILGMIQGRLWGWQGVLSKLNGHVVGGSLVGLACARFERMLRFQTKLNSGTSEEFISHRFCLAINPDASPEKSTLELVKSQSGAKALAKLSLLGLGVQALLLARSTSKLIHHRLLALTPNAQ